MAGKQILMRFLQTLAILTGLLAVIVLIRFPVTEGRAAGLDLFHVYTDPFILYGYAASIVLFVALYKAFKLFGYVARDQIGAPDSLKALKSIRHCAVILGIFIVAAGLYIWLFHAKEDDPAGFLAMCIAAVFVCAAAAIAAVITERKWQKIKWVQKGMETG